MVSIGSLVDLFADVIPLHAATRKWALNYRDKAAVKFATPDHMRFYLLTQQLHWLGCSFTTRLKTRDTMVRIHPRTCPVCGALFVREKQVQTCGVTCGRLLRYPRP